MSSRRSAPHPSQMAFSFDPPALAVEEASLAGLDRYVAACVARALKEDERPRAHVAGAMSALLDDEISKLMLDAYASEARDNHNISAGRFFALIAATGRFDLLDAVLTRFGARVLVGEEVLTAELGHVDRQIAQLNERKRLLQAQAKPFKRGAGHS